MKIPSRFDFFIRNMFGIALILTPALLEAHDLKVCKLTDATHPVSGSFIFEIGISSTPTSPYQFSHFATVSVLAGACSEEITGGGFGPYLITEIATPGTTVSDITSIIVWNPDTITHPPDNGFISSNLGARTATVFADSGGTTTVSFTNMSSTASNQGCTPGYYKQPQHLDSWPTTYTSSTVVGTVFAGVDASLAGETFLDALQGGGGPGLVGAETILLRAAVAGLLNASVSGISYPLTPSAVIAQVDAALESGSRDVILALASTLDTFNNGGCPLS